MSIKVYHRGLPVIGSKDSDMGNVCRRRNEQTTELGDAIHGTVDRVDEATIHVFQTEGENLTINT